MTLSCRMALTLAAAAMLTAPALAQPEQAFTRQADDPALEWADCPGFMPEGCGLAVLQGDPGQRNADIFFRLPGGATAIRHWHSSAERMVLVSGQMRVDGVDATLADESHQVERPARAVDRAAGAGERLVPEERAVLDRLGDADELLHDDSSGPEVEVPDLAVADLAFGQSDGESRCVEQRVRRTSHEGLPGRRRRERNRVAVPLRAVPPTIKDDKHYRTLRQIDSLWWNVRC
jgi:hypothetical protein